MSKFRKSEAVGRECHYCGAPATTRDHIVPRFLLPRLDVASWFRQLNIVPACSPCNHLKGHRRSHCSCDHCTAAWEEYHKFWWALPADRIVWMDRKFRTFEPERDRIEVMAASFRLEADEAEERALGEYLPNWAK